MKAQIESHGHASSEIRAPGVVRSDDEADVDLDMPSRHRAPAPHPTRSGVVRCLGCDTPFESWDRTRNRLCPRCRNRQ